MPLECCVCEFSDMTSEKGVRKAQKRLPLVPKPDVLLLTYKTSYNYLCQHCLARNTALVDKSSSRTDFTPEEVYECLHAGRTELAKLIMDQLLIQKNYSVCKNYKDPHSHDNLLHLTSKYGFWHLSRYILQNQFHGVASRKGASNALNKLQQTPLTIGCTNDNRDDMVLLFCKAGSDPNYILNDSTCLMRACASGQDMCIDILHRYGARLDDRSVSNGRTALMKATMLGELDCVRALLRAGADRKCRDFNGCTALLYASRRTLLDEKYVDIVRCLNDADLYFEKKRNLRNLDSSSVEYQQVHFLLPLLTLLSQSYLYFLFHPLFYSSYYTMQLKDSKSKQFLNFHTISVTDTQGQKWESLFDEISQCVMWRNASSGMSTYKRPESIDEVWMREQVLRDAKDKKDREDEANNWIEKWDELSENPYWYHRVTNASTWVVPPDVKPTGWKPPNDTYHETLKQKYYNAMGIVNANIPHVPLKEEDRVYDEEGGWWDGTTYFDAYGGWYDENGEYDDGCQGRVKKYDKKQIKKTKKRMGGKSKWKGCSWSDRLDCLIEDHGLSKEEEEEKTEKMAKEMEAIRRANGDTVVVKGTFGIVYNRKSNKTKEELEEEAKELKNAPWSWTAADEKEILKKKKDNYAKMNRK